MTAEPLDRNRRIWDRMSPGYDRQMRSVEPLLIGRDQRPWVCAQAQGDVLEVAIGTGLNLPHYPPGIRLTGVDLSPAMLAAADRRAAGLGLNVDLAEAPAERLPYGDAAFDTVICTLSLCSVANDRAAIAETHRVLRPGGRLVRVHPIPLPESASLSKINLGGQRVEPLPVLLDGERVWISSVDQLEIFDITSGAVTGTLRPAHEPALSPSTQNPFVGGNPAQPPVLAETGAQRRVVTAFAATAPGKGTTPPRPVIEILAADAGTGREAQRIEIEPSDDDHHALTRKHQVVIGAHGPVVVAQVGTDTVAVNLDDRREVWRRPDFALGSVAGDVAVGTDAKSAVARALAIDSGAERWHTGPAETIAIKPGSPKIVTATGAWRGRKQFFRLLDAATGRLLDESTATSSTAYNITCLHDGRSVTICQDQRQDWAGAFDDSGKWLWELPDKKANRIAPTVTTAWHGAVYGRTANGPVILDARTGEDRETAPGLTPWLVNEHAAVASPPDARGGVLLYRATG